MSGALIDGEEDTGLSDVFSKVRQEIAAGAPHDDEELKRLALVATSRLASVDAKEMQSILEYLLLHSVLAREFRSEEMVAEAMRDLDASLAMIAQKG